MESDETLASDRELEFSILLTFFKSFSHAVIKLQCCEHNNEAENFSRSLETTKTLLIFVSTDEVGKVSTFNL
jgi:hypothetical protein